MASASQPVETQARRTTSILATSDDDRDAVVGAPETSTEDSLTGSKSQNMGSKTEQSTQEADAQNRTESAEPSTEWIKHKEQMNRLTAAVNRAMRISESEEDDVSHRVNTLTKAINISFDDSKPIKVPWDACRIWPRMEAFLQEWFCQDHVALKAINDGHFIIRDERAGGIAPTLWESVVRPDAEITFSVSNSQSSSANRPSKTCYESRIQYKVSYFQRPEAGGRAEFVDSVVYSEPVKFEVVNEHEQLPAIEEIKQIEASDDISARIRVKTRVPQLRESDTVGKTTLKINSPYLLNVLKSIIEYSAEPPAGDDQGLDAGVFKYPYKDLYLHLDDLLKYRSHDSKLQKRHSDDFNKLADEHIGLLQKYLLSQPGIPYQEVKDRASGKTPLTTFGTYWLLMKPGTDVYVREDDGSLNRYVLDSLTGGIAKDGQDDKDTKGNKDTAENKANLKYTAQVWNLRLDDKAIRQFVRYVDIQVFDDERVITDLRVFPVRYHDEFDNGDMHKYLIERGQKYLKYSKKPYFLQYDGIGLKPGSRSYKRARVIVEHGSRPWKYSILPSHMFAFILNDRVYDLLDVATLEKPSMAETAIDKLVIDKESKTLIKAIAQTHIEKSEEFKADFISGKGDGKILLLHGPPGTGKTLTAESVAEFTGRPLLSIAVADLGYYTHEIEVKLLQWFRRANDWDAIVLLDEADVFLAQRSDDLQRNSVVSVFLRAFDYFQGILFLTTNRVAQFDEAFKSRIHLSLGYKKLDNAAREEIWNNLFEKLREDHKSGGLRIEYDYYAQQYVNKDDEVKALEWNGREIRNGNPVTSLTLAVYDAKHPSKPSDKPLIPEVKKKHLEQVVKMSSAFREYMLAANEGKDDSVMAYQAGNRIE
ncbi:hypothetical protein E8E13_009476 [Curvularia kusanoi]|uniref:AAA+ ATPase domain-containing protein n=1 Tax=Curvularia kusanoi TaxID=90978 RepID=A0A9P4W908_CURKU|nr:hypothetical protein E8E13_009476 [Curvularia kusanoi]